MDLRLFKYTSADEFQRSAKAVIIFCGNTSVFVHTDRHYEPADLLNPSDFLNTSNHDSCWRTDGMRFMFDMSMVMVDEMNEERVRAGFSKLAPREFDQFCALGHTPWRFVTVTHAKLRPDEPYKRRLLKVERAG